ncbi:MAG: phosphatase [Bacilli bacterium]
MKNDLVKEAKQEYFRNWRKNNKDKVKKSNAKYWLKKAELLKTQKKEGANNGNK